MPAPPSPDLTRHQLDELDALLQRMLNLPLATAPQPAPVPPAPVAVVAVPADWRADAAQTRPELAAWDEPAEEAVIPFAAPRTLRGVDAPATPVGLNPAPAADADEPVDLEAAPFAAPGTPTVPLLLWPLAALNAVLEWTLGLFGPLGSWAKSPGAKTLLGLTGLAMLVSAGLWAARGAGYLR